MPCKPIGNPRAPIVLVGEAPGEEEERSGVPFVGASGRELRQCLAEAGIEDVPGKWAPEWDKAQSLFLCNVFSERPPNNNLEVWMVRKAELPSGYNLPPLSRGKFLHPSRRHHLDTLYATLSALSPNVIVALGGTALWALTGLSGISNYRGAIVQSPWGKVLPTFHPAAILRQWGSRPVLVADLGKARVHSATREYQRPSRRLLVEPRLDEVQAFFAEHLGPDGPPISVDVETKKGQITCLAFAPKRDLGICIPFIRDDNSSYWPDLTTEVQVWKLIRDLLSGPRELLFQNGSYDVQYFLHHGIQVRNYCHDSMVRQHALFPELQKSLGFLGSIYTDEPAWKLMRRQKADTEKREE